MSLMIFGCGYSGQAIAQAFRHDGFEVSGTTRSPEKAALLEHHHIRGFLFDAKPASDALLKAMANATHLVQSISPGETGDCLLDLYGEKLGTVMPRLEWIGYLSTIGVYGNHDGAWVDETTICKPVSQRSITRLETEQAWTSLGSQLSIPVSIMRLSGIYGPNRNVFCNLDKKTARRLIKKDQVFNRIRVEDIGAAARFLAQHQCDGIYNITDDEPAPPQDVITQAARLMGIEPPPEQSFETADLTPMARSFYGENKRVSNKKLQDTGFQLRYPDYRFSLAQLWSSGRWTS